MARLPAHAAIRLPRAWRNLARHRDGDFRRRGESQRGLPFIARDGFPDDGVRCAAWLVAGQSGNPEIPPVGAKSRPLLSAAGTVGIDQLPQQLRLPLRRRSLRKPGRLRASAPPLPLHHCLRCRPGWRPGLWRSGQSDSQVPHGHGHRYRDRRRQLRRQESTGLSKWHCAIGTIRYDALGEGATPGTLVYIKSSLTGDEASDVLSYRAQELAFPHQSTSDQWFDESQFESYRKLGYHAGCTTFEVV